MPIRPEQFESSDTQGTTTHFNGTVGTTSTAVPAVAGAVIAEVMVSNPSGPSLLVSFDGGTNFFTLKANTTIAWSVRGEKTQIHIKAASGTTDYEILMNREPV